MCWETPSESHSYLTRRGLTDGSGTGAMGVGPGIQPSSGVGETFLVVRLSLGSDGWITVSQLEGRASRGCGFKTKE